MAVGKVSGHAHGIKRRLRPSLVSEAGGRPKSSLGFGQDIRYGHQSVHYGFQRRRTAEFGEGGRSPEEFRRQEGRDKVIQLAPTRTHAYFGQLRFTNCSPLPSGLCSLQFFSLNTSGFLFLCCCCLRLSCLHLSILLTHLFLATEVSN